MRLPRAVLLALAIGCLAPALGSAIEMGEEAKPAEEYVKTRIATMRYADAGPASGTTYTFSKQAIPSSLRVDLDGNLFVYFPVECGLRQYDAEGKYVRTITWEHEICSRPAYRRNTWEIQMTEEGEVVLLSGNSDFRREVILVHPDGKQENIKLSGKPRAGDYRYEDGCVVDKMRGVIGRTRRAKWEAAKEFVGLGGKGKKEGKKVRRRPGVPGNIRVIIEPETYSGKDKSPMTRPVAPGELVLRPYDVKPYSIPGTLNKCADLEGNIYVIYPLHEPGLPYIDSKKRFLGKYGPNGKLKAWVEMEDGLSGSGWGVSGDGRIFQVSKDPIKADTSESTYLLTKWEIKR